jgi:hypothetical protein
LIAQGWRRAKVDRDIVLTPRGPVGFAF